jgi:hypothetical protein
MKMSRPTDPTNSDRFNFTMSREQHSQDSMSSEVTARIRLAKTVHIPVEEITSFDHEELSDEEIASRTRSKVANTIIDSLSESPMNYIDVTTTETDRDTNLELTVANDGVSITEYEHNEEGSIVVDEWWYTWAELSEILTGISQPPDVV